MVPLAPAGQFEGARCHNVSVDVLGSYGQPVGDLARLFGLLLDTLVLGRQMLSVLTPPPMGPALMTDTARREVRGDVAARLGLLWCVLLDHGGSLVEDKVRHGGVKTLLGLRRSWSLVVMVIL